MEGENSLYVYRNEKNSSRTPYVAYSNESSLENLTLITIGENLSEREITKAKNVVNNYHSSKHDLVDELKRRFPRSFSSFLDHF